MLMYLSPRIQEKLDDYAGWALCLPRILFLLILPHFAKLCLTRKIRE